MKLFKYRLNNHKYGIGVVDCGGFISIFHMGFTDNTYTSLRVINDRVSELVVALGCVYSRQKNKVIIANCSPNSNRSIQVNRSGYGIHISNLCINDNVALRLVQILVGGISKRVLDIEEFICPICENGVWHWIFVFNFGHKVVIAKSDEYDNIQGMIIPTSKTYTVSNKLLREHEARIKNGSPNTQYDMANPYGRGELVLPGSNSIQFVGETLKTIYFSQWP